MICQKIKWYRQRRHKTLLLPTEWKGLKPVPCRRACLRVGGGTALFSVSRWEEIPKFQPDSNLVGTDLEFWN